MIHHSALSVLLLAAALVLPCGARAEDPPPGPKVGDTVPDVTLTLLDGSSRRLSEVGGEKATVIYVMATW